MKKAKKAAKRREWFTFNNAVVFVIILMVIAVLRAMVSTETITVRTKANLEQEAIELLNAITDENMPISILE